MILSPYQPHQLVPGQLQPSPNQPNQLVSGQYQIAPSPVGIVPNFSFPTAAANAMVCYGQQFITAHPTSSQDHSHSADKDKKFAFEYLMDHFEGTNTRLRHEAERNEEEKKRQILK